MNAIWWAANSRCTFAIGSCTKQDIMENITADEVDKIQSAMLCAIPKTQAVFLCTCMT